MKRERRVPILWMNKIEYFKIIKTFLMPFFISGARDRYRERNFWWKI